MDQDAYDDLLQRLTVLVVKMDASLDELKEFNRQQIQINARLETTLAAIKDLLGRGNGRDA
jgi:hypothetical protein